MEKWTYSIPVYHIVAHDSLRPIGPFTGTVEADRYSHACTQAWKAIATQLEQRGYCGQGDRAIGMGDLHVELLQCRKPETGRRVFSPKGAPYA